ncbi:alanyl-tRNA editing protein [Vibrio vulnificus]|uniref:alanyl-tRNA editing protein n=1 Tax=Vibrio vulnificus TaxID=672 RepID=UPI003F67E154
MQITPTKVRFCHQTWQLESDIVLTSANEHSLYVVTQHTPFHPVSHIWPDHPADRGSLIADGKEWPIIGCWVGAVECSTGQLFVDQAIPVKRDTEGWSFVVVHEIEAERGQLSVGCKVRLSVDKEYQQSLSRGHSAGHLAYLALNKVLAQDYWRKDADRKDPHGYYDFNSYAQESSFVTPECCLDTYRLGKTLRKRGLNSADVVENIQEIESEVNVQLEHWLARGSEIFMNCHGEYLTDSRYWQCDLGEASTAIIPCGGTHAAGLFEMKEIAVTLVLLDEQTIEMHTQVTPNREK